MIESQLISQNTCVVQLPQPYAFKEADRGNISFSEIMSLALCFISWFYWSCLLCYLAISMRGGSQQWIGIDHVYWCITWYEIILMVPNLISFGSSRWVWKASCLDESARLPFCNDARIARELGKAPSQNSCHYLWWWLFRQLTKCLSYFRKISGQGNHICCGWSSWSWLVDL